MPPPPLTSATAEQTRSKIRSQRALAGNLLVETKSKRIEIAGSLQTAKEENETRETSGSEDPSLRGKGKPRISNDRGSAAEQMVI